MTSDPLRDLLQISTGALCPRRRVDFDTDTGPLLELSELLGRRNGFFAFNAGLQVFPAGPGSAGIELASWNESRSWKETYGGAVDDLFCFAQDLFGLQFAIEGGQRIVALDPESCQRTHLGTTLRDWAAQLLDAPDVHGTRAFATAWQDAHGALRLDQRLIPWQPFVLGGTYDHGNLTVKNAVECMRIRGPIAQAVLHRPQGHSIQLSVQ